MRYSGIFVVRMEKHARKGRLVYISGKLQTRRWRKDGEDSDRFSTEILLAPGGRVQVLDRPNGANGAPAATAEASGTAAREGNGSPTAQAPAATQDDLDNDLPF